MAKEKKTSKLVNQQKDSASTKDTNNSTDIIKFLKGFLGASGLGATILYIIGFVIVNTNLLSYGAYELSVLRIEFLAAGIAFLAIIVVVNLVGIQVGKHLLSEALKKKWKEWKSPKNKKQFGLLIFIFIFIFIWIIFYIVNVDINIWQKNEKVFFWAIMFAVAGSFYYIFWDNEEVWGKLSDFVITRDEIKDLIIPALSGFTLFLFALVTYGTIVYPQLPRSWGGGSPIFVQFVVDEEAKVMLETMGLQVEESGLTERVTYLTESEEQIFVVTQQGDTLAFDPNLVKASKFYPVNYYASVEQYGDRGDWYMDQGDWDNAIIEYDSALRIEANMLDALLGKTTAYIEKYRLDFSDTDSFEKAESAGKEAKLQSEKQNNDQFEALASYQLSRLYFINENNDKTIKNLQDAIEIDTNLREEAIRDEVFYGLIFKYTDKDTDININVNTDRLSAFREALQLTEDDKGLAALYAQRGNQLIRGGDLEQAIIFYDIAIAISYQDQGEGEDENLIAQYHAKKGDILRRLGRNVEAIVEYEDATDKSEEDIDYLYSLSEINYDQGDFESAETHCKKVVEITQEREGDDEIPRITCLVLLGDMYRDGQIGTGEEVNPLEEAREKYHQALFEYKEYTSTDDGIRIDDTSYVLIARINYEWARVFARLNQEEAAIEKLEIAVLLDHSRLEVAVEEADFEVLHGRDDYQRIISPPVFETIEKIDETTIRITLKEPVDDLVERVNIITSIFYEEDIVGLEFVGQEDASESTEGKFSYTLKVLTLKDPKITLDAIVIKLINLYGLGT